MMTINHPLLPAFLDLLINLSLPQHWFSHVILLLARLHTV